MLEKIKNLSIVRKIQLIALSVSFIALLSMGLATCGSIIDFTEYSRNSILNFGTYASDNSEEALKKQSESYLEELSEILADLSENILQKVSEQTKGIAVGMESIYRNKENFKGSLPPLPDMTQKGESGNGFSACGKAYVVDPENSTEDEILVYDPGEYPSEFEANVYRTDINTWMKLTPEERYTIKNTRNVVSNRLMPSALKSQLSVISNIFYTIKPMYVYNNEMSSAYIGTESGIVYRYNTSSSPTRYDPRERDWYQKAIEEQKSGSDSAVWVDTYIDSDTRNLCITCSKAFCDLAGNALGVSAVDMFLSDVNKYILNSRNDRGGYAFIVNKSGEIIMHPDYSDDVISAATSEEDKSFMYRPLEQEIDETYRSLIEKMKAGETGVSKAIINGKEYYVAYSRMEETGWSMGIASDVEGIIAPVTKIKNGINDTVGEITGIIGGNLTGLWLKLGIVFLVCTLIIIILSTLMSGKVVKPIMDLKKYSEKIGQGDLSISIPVESGDEIGELAAAFNKMTSDLEMYIEDLAETTADRERIHSELSVAKKIQFSMLPCIFPAFPDRKDFDVYAIMDPAKEVGGDFYDFFFTDKEHLAIVIADVSGKGISAALFMVISKILIKNAAQSGLTPSEVFESVNDQLCENNDAGMFVTVFMGILNINTGEFIFSSAGHNPPLIYRKSENKFDFLKTAKSFVLGGIKGIKFKDSTIKLLPEDILYTYTDGVTEAMNKKGELFSPERLISILNGINVKEVSIKDIVINIRSEIDKFAAGFERVDDITMLVLRDFTIGDERTQNL